MKIKFNEPFLDLTCQPQAEFEIAFYKHLSSFPMSRTVLYQQSILNEYFIHGSNVVKYLNKHRVS